MLKTFLNILLSLTIFCTGNSLAEETPKTVGINQKWDLKWELGAGLAGFDIPLYVGSSQNKQYLIPVPYLKLSSRYLEFDRGFKGFLFTSPSVRLDISAELGVPVRSKDSRAREGMPNLDTVLQLGPSVEVTLAGSRRAKNELRLEFPIRTAIATDIKSVENVGWIFEPRVTFESRRQGRQGKYHFGQGLEYSATLGLRYATSDYHAYYYDVAPQFVTPERTAFESDKGYSGLVGNVVVSWRQGEWLYWSVLRYRNLNGVVYEDSPLVERKDYFLVGVGVSWVFARSL